ncbi:hypothetical protein P168DRAFT_238758 [Aspergillus campestris IBT 28561]|uniref:Pheromone-regulated membrane protein n=1 Tax=Aspergillus campestris (strain IBT 28561) TaxID=1392248 RepID=A0A2I1D0D9_ASPC2|nr:uncharacterized protein P168DRAFT_238758 [Aspergillus campestris IBT 28561]PKY03337.1 hypothetical protein P168DRAFT_238758 [Aspergillus campestris IBT 28561]
MPCCGDREKGGPVSLEEQWDYINLDDFKSESCLSPFSYFWLWVFLIVSLAVYGVDTFTAVNLLAFSRWAGQIEPAIPFAASRWVFAVCIIISFVLLVLRWLRAIRAIRSGSIAKSYLDSLAVRIQSIRMGQNGRGWRRFLVFAELTKDRKGAEYIALFTYFSFETWMNTLFADGPRQVVNAITLYSVMQMDLLPGGKHASEDQDQSGASQFFNNVKILAENNNLRAVILCGMLFTVVVWVLSILKLLLAIMFYVFFLFHHIPEKDGSLKSYCKRKINQRLTRIVRRKVDKALNKGVALQDRTPTGLSSRPTLPVIGPDLDKGPAVATISRSTTETTLPVYTSRPGTAAGQRPTLPDLGGLQEKPPLSRSVTQSSGWSDGTAVSGYSPLDRQASPAPPVPALPSHMVMAGSRSQTPMSRSAYTPSPAPAGVMTNRMLPPIATSGSPFRPFSPAVDPSGRSYTPANQSATGYADQAGMRTFSPAPAPQNPQFNNPGAYYSPARGTPAPASRMGYSTPVYQENLAAGRPTPAQQYPPRGYGGQPQPPRTDYF